MRLSASAAAEAVAYARQAPLAELMQKADAVCRQHHQDAVFLRGLIEFSNHCAADCAYCGIRRSHTAVQRYRMTPEAIVALAERGWRAGLRTFVLQGGEDPWFTPDRMTALLEQIRQVTEGQVALTLSVGIRPRAVYRAWKQAGADRYLMRFETSDAALYARLKPGARLADRLRALEDLAAEGYQVGSGYLVGLPGETPALREQNALLCWERDFAMVGIGPFIPHPATPLADAPQQPLELTLRSVALLRLLLPTANLPATTAAGSLDRQGREKMLAAGANVLMPNLTPESFKKDYLLYPGKICLDESGFDCISCLDVRTHLVRKTLDYSRGDYRA